MLLKVMVFKHLINENQIFNIFFIFKHFIFLYILHLGKSKSINDLSVDQSKPGASSDEQRQKALKEKSIGQLFISLGKIISLNFICHMTM